MAFTPFVETDQPTMANFNEKFQECIQAAENMIETGSYVGDGSNEKAIMFSMSPSLVIVYQNNIFLNSETAEPGHFYILWMPGITQEALFWDNSLRGQYICSFSFSQNTLTMTGRNNSTNNSQAAMNSSGKTYYYIAIGKGASE